LYLPPPEVRILMPTSEREPQAWRYTTKKPDDQWHETEFDDSNWESGPGGFGAGEVRDAATRTAWNTSDIWLRRTFDVSDLPDRGQIILNILHDEDAEVYINGSLVESFKGFRKSYRSVLLDENARNLLREGKNTIAVHCRQTVGGQYIDVGLVEMIDKPQK
jgi:hypothetical protein